MGGGDIEGYKRDSDPAVEEIIELLASLFLDELCTISVCAFILYDWAVTLAREVRLFWTGKARPLSAILYFSNKYLNILSHIIYVVEDSSAPLSDQSCTRLGNVQRIIFFSSFIPPAVFAGLRAYALTQRRWLSALVFLLSIIQFVTNMVLLRFFISGVHVPILGGCLNSVGTPISLVQTFAIANRVSVILADIILAVVTWKLLPDSNIIRGATTKINGLASTMVWNGMIYFIVLSILNILQLIFTELSIATYGEYNNVSIFTAPLSSVLVSHFLLDLQEAHQRKAVGLASSDHLHSSQSLGSAGPSIDFANALGSLGATINPAHYFGREPEDDDECVDGPSADIVPSNEGGEPSQESRIDDEFAIAEVPPRRGEMGVQRNELLESPFPKL